MRNCMLNGPYLKWELLSQKTKARVVSHIVGDDVGVLGLCRIVSEEFDDND